MIVKLIRPWNNWDAGHVFATMQESVAKVLVSRGVGVEIPPSCVESVQYPESTEGAIQEMHVTFNTKTGKGKK